jgi:predicted nucleic-acid-binding Zn-ribbon protein
MVNSFLCQKCGNIFLYPAKKIAVQMETDVNEASVTIESQVCPICGSLNYTLNEVPAAPAPEISALIESPLCEVNSHIAEGYKVLPDKLYAKSAILVKYASPADAKPAESSETLPRGHPINDPTETDETGKA